MIEDQTKLKAALLLFGVLLGICIFYTIKTVVSMCEKEEKKVETESVEGTEEGEWEDESEEEDSVD